MYDDILGPKENKIPEINFEVEKVVVKAKPRKLKAKWTEEMKNNLKEEYNHG